MSTLPYTFDTTLVWQQIVKIWFTFAGVLVISIVGAVATGKTGGAIGLALAFVLVFWLSRRVRAFPMGAAGTLSETVIETRPVRVWWYSLPVPVGRFQIEGFESIHVVERAFVSHTATRSNDTGSVQLIGKVGTPNIELAFCDIDQAMTIGHELAGALHLPVQRIDGPGLRTVRVTLG